MSVLEKGLKMSSSEHTISMSGQESLTEGFEELVEWKALVGSSGERDAGILYIMDEEFYFLLLDEKNVGSGMAYRRPKDEHLLGRNRKLEVVMKRMSYKFYSIK